jgi:hypothetical protein
MAQVPVDNVRVSACRQIAAAIAADVQLYINAHTSVGVERCAHTARMAWTIAVHHSSTWRSIAIATN